MRYVRRMAPITKPAGISANVPIGRNVRAERVRRGEKQAAVARVIGVSQTAYSERERGEVPFTGAELFVIAAAFGLEVAAFFPSEVPAIPVARLSHAVA